MELFESIAKRHSYRGPFRDQALPKEDLRKIVEAGIRAPSAKNVQTTQFVIVDDPELVQAINAMPRANAAMQKARAYIACLIDTNPEPIFAEYSFQLEDCAAAVENMLLAITALGYATVWVDGWLRLEQHAQRIGKLLGIPETKTIRVILPLGVPVEAHAQREKLPFEQRAWFNRYGGKEE